MDYKAYTTGEMIDLISKDSKLVFEAVTGLYNGNTVALHEDLEWLMWKDDNTYFPISFNSAFMETKWKLLSTVHMLQVNVPLFDSGKTYYYFK